MHMRHGYPFYFSPRDLPTKTKNHSIFIKYGMTEFSSFSTHERFYEWFDSYREDCLQNDRAFKIFEIIMDGRPTAFYADIEGVSPLETSDDDLLMIRYKIKSVFRDKYALMGGDPDTLIWMEDHREHKGTIKTSFHAIGPSTKFTDVKNHGSMRKYADKMNSMITPEILHMNMNISFWSKDGKTNNVLDMRVYHSQRPMRTIFSSKTSKERGFVLCEECKYVDFRECFINLNIKNHELESHNFISVDTEGKPPFTKQTYTPSSDTQVIPYDTTDEHKATMKDIQHILTNYYNHILTGIKFNGVYKDKDQYRIDGIRECPVCDIKHDSNGAYISDLKNGEYMYKCLTMGPLNNRNVCVSSQEIHEVVASEEPNYLQSLLGIDQKCVSVCAGMGVGKTYQLIKYLENLPPDTPVLWLTPRVAMVTSILGRLTGLQFESYKENIYASRLVMEIESLHRVFMQHPVIIMDEGRSLMSSLMSYETNGDNLLNHIEILKEQCQCAERVFIVGADIHIDGAVPAFIKDVFQDDQVFNITHIDNLLKWRHIFMYNEPFYQRMYKSIADGERIVIVCGSSMDLREIEIAASRVIERKKMIDAQIYDSSVELERAIMDVKTCSQVGAYHAECEIKHELTDVNTTWAKYQVILFTSTITVSVDYQGEIDRVYSIPSIMTANDREFQQMECRPRNNISREVIVRYDGQHITPRENNDTVLYKKEMSKIMTQRKYVEKTRKGYEREIFNSIKKKGFGYQAKYTPTLATQLYAWNNVETYKKVNDWYPSYLALLQMKGREWVFQDIRPMVIEKTHLEKDIEVLKNDRMDILTQNKERMVRAKQTREAIRELSLDERKEIRSNLKDEKYSLDQALNQCREKIEEKKNAKRIQEENTPPGFVHASKKRKKDIRAGDEKDLGEVDTLVETQRTLKYRVMKKFANNANKDDHLVLKKNFAQRHFTDKLTGTEVLFFNKNKRAILNRVLYTTYPKIMRHKLHANNIEMSISNEYVSMDVKLFDILDMIVIELGLESISDTTEFDWWAMEKAGNTSKITTLLGAMDKMTGADHSCSTDFTRLRHYFKKVLGYKFSANTSKITVNGRRVSYSKYELTCALDGILEKPNTILDHDWLEEHCKSYNKYVIQTHYMFHDEAVSLRKLTEQTKNST